MLYSLKGILREILPPNKLILEVNFLAWEILIPLNLVEILRENFIGKEIQLFVVPILRKNEYLELYGFLEREERELFLKLNALSKVGPKLALNMLSIFSPETLRGIIYDRKIEELAKIPGVGVKKAERLYVELKGLFSKLSKKGLTLPIERERTLSEAKASLISLGFKAQEAEEVLLKVYDERDSLEELIKKALKSLAPSFIEERC
ncbi:MAG: Holliday junction branch migration protein RuvA [Caldimicrobium sp.]|nr:Holliday junction branch migration protein RuvA [Caldimicrobium sp.]